MKFWYLGLLCSCSISRAGLGPAWNGDSGQLDGGTDAILNWDSGSDTAHDANDWDRGSDTAHDANDWDRSIDAGPDYVFEAETDLAHASGWGDRDGWCNEGGTLVYGPYIVLPGDAYLVTFRLLTNDNVRSDVIVNVRVQAPGLREELNIRSNEFVEPLVYQDFDINLLSPGDRQLEFIVQPISTYVCVDHVSVTEVP